MHHVNVFPQKYYLVFQVGHICIMEAWLMVHPTTKKKKKIYKKIHRQKQFITAMHN